MSRRMFSCALFVVASVWFASHAVAATFVSDTPVIPNPNEVDASTNLVEFTSPVSPKLVAIKMKGWRGGADPPAAPGLPVSSFFDVFTELSLDDGSGAVHNYQGTLSGQMEIEALSLNGLPPGEPWVWRSALGTLSGSLDGGPGVAPLLLRESPTLQSTGGGTVSPPPPPTPVLPAVPTYYRMGSFFDIFTEISLDGGQTWLAATGPSHLESVPEPSTLALGLLGFAAVGLAARRRLRAERPPSAQQRRP